jgi:hypothetical protein
MKILLTALAGSLLLASGGAMAQGMGDGRMNHGNGPMVVHQTDNGQMHRDNRGNYRNSRNMRRHRHYVCWRTWRNHHRVRVCGWR